MSEETREDTGVTAAELGHAIESARSMVAEQFQIAERLDRKANYQAATAGAFFAVVQAVAINAITGAHLTADWITTLAAIAVPSALFTIGAMGTASRAWITQGEKDLPIADLRDLIDRMQRGDEYALRSLAHHYVNVAEERREGNGERLKRVRRAGDAALLSIALTGLELILIFVALGVNYG